MKNIIDNAISLGQILEFEEALPGETPLKPEEYLKGASKNFILNVAALFLGFKAHNSKFDDNRELLRMIFRTENDNFASEVYARIKVMEQKGAKIGVINAYSSLSLFERFFQQDKGAETQSPSEFEVSLFKAYLALNSEFVNAQKVAFTSTEELDDDLKIAMMMFCMHYPVSDKVNYDIHQIWATQSIKAIYLFEFLESHVRTKPLLDAFLIHFNSPTWQYYLKSLIPLTVPAIQQKAEAHTDIVINPGDKFEEGCAFLEKLMVQESEELAENDFLSLRAKPFYKVKDGVYRIIFNLFVVEKIFKGAYFLLRDINEKLPAGQKILEFKSFYGDEFSEKALFYKVIESIYPDKCIRYSGKQLADMQINGAPDYYIRKAKNILLFESKDFLIRADKKASFDYNVYESEFERVLYYERLPNGQEKHKAVMQLINNVRRILKNEFTADKDYYYKDVFIYPILVTHDHQYDTPGFNNLLNYWFQDELQGLQEEGLFIHHVKPLAVVNIDSLIYNQIGLSQKITLHEVLNLYEEQIKINPKLKFQSFEELKQYRMSKLIPFSLFIDKYFYKQGIWKLPPILELIAPALFKEEFEKNLTKDFDNSSLPY